MKVIYATPISELLHEALVAAKSKGKKIAHIELTYEEFELFRAEFSRDETFRKSIVWEHGTIPMYRGIPLCLQGEG